MDLQDLKYQLNRVIDQWADQNTPEPVEDEARGFDVETTVEPEKERQLPEGKRVVRTKSSGDRVYLLDDVNNTRQWLTTPEVLKDQGFETGDVTEVTDEDLLKYNMASAIYKVNEKI